MSDVTTLSVLLGDEQLPHINFRQIEYAVRTIGVKAIKREKLCPSGCCNFAREEVDTCPRCNVSQEARGCLTLLSLSVPRQIECILSREQNTFSKIDINGIAGRRPNDSLYSSRVWKKFVTPYENKCTDASPVIPLSLGFDGVMIAKDFWIVCATLDCLEREDRYKPRNMIIVCILERKPSVSTGMFRTLANLLREAHPERTGVASHNGLQTFYIILLSVRVDYPAACLFCMARGSSAATGGCYKCMIKSPSGFNKQLFNDFNNHAPPRTDAELRKWNKRCMDGGGGNVTQNSLIGSTKVNSLFSSCQSSPTPSTYHSTQCIYLKVCGAGSLASSVARLRSRFPRLRSRSSRRASE